MDIDEKSDGTFQLQTALKWMIVFAIFVFLGKMVWEQLESGKGTLLLFSNLFRLVLSSLIFAFSYFIQVWAWYLITLKTRDRSFFL